MGTQYECENQNIGRGTVTRPIFIDLDDLSTVAAGAKDANGSSIQAGILIGGGLLAFVGTKTAIDQIVASAAQLKRLSAEKQRIAEAIDGHTARLSELPAGISPQIPPLMKRLELPLINLSALQEKNSLQQFNETIKYYFSGIAVSVGTAGMGVGDFLHPGIWSVMHGIPNSSLAALGTLSAATLALCVPFITLFGSANAYREGIKACHTCRVPESTLKANLDPDIYHKLSEQLQLSRQISGASAAAYTLTAIGAPLTLAIGPMGLPVLMPGVAGLMSTGVLKTKYLEYDAHLSVEEAGDLGDISEISNQIRAVDYQLAEMNTHLRAPQNDPGANVRDFLFRSFQIHHHFLAYKLAVCQKQLALVAAVQKEDLPDPVRHFLPQVTDTLHHQASAIQKDLASHIADARTLYESIDQQRLTGAAFEVMIKFLKKEGLEDALVQRALHYAPPTIKKHSRGHYYLKYANVIYFLDHPEKMPKSYPRFLDRFCDDMRHSIEKHVGGRHLHIQRELLDLLYLRFLENRAL